jgi:hypothetical protein
MLVKFLNAEHPQRNADLHCDYRALYEGGYRFRERVERFLCRNPSEPPAVYKDRCKEAPYRSYIGTVIDYLTAQLFSVAPQYKAESGATPEWFNEFEDNCDGRGTNLSEMLRAVMVDALVHKTGTIHLEFPRNYGAAASRYDADQAGATGVVLRRVERQKLVDWECDDLGNLLWLISYESQRPRETPLAMRDATRHTWRVLSRDSAQIYQVDVPSNDFLRDESDITAIADVSHGLGIVPAVQITIPDGLWIANRLESPQLEHFRLSSGNSWSIKRTCYAMPVFKVAPDWEPSTMGAGYYLKIGPEDDAKYLAPPVEHLTVSTQETKAQKDEIFRIVTQMSLGVDNNAAAVGRSGKSKLADAEAMAITLGSYARILKDATKTVLGLLSRARGDDVRWSVEGLDKYETLDPEMLITLLKDAGDIPSRQFKIESAYRKAIGLLPGLTEEVKADIHKEIEDGVDNEEDAENELQELARANGFGTAQGGSEADPGTGSAAAAAAQTEGGEGVAGGRSQAGRGSDAGGPDGRDAGQDKGGRVRARNNRRADRGRDR